MIPFAAPHYEWLIALNRFLGTSCDDFAAISNFSAVSELFAGTVRMSSAVTNALPIPNCGVLLGRSSHLTWHL